MLKAKEAIPTSFELLDLKAFIEIPLISGYVDLTQRPMFCQCSADVHNDAVFI